MPANSSFRATSYLLKELIMFPLYTFPSPTHRRVAYTLVFETIAIASTTLILLLLGHDPAASILLSVVTSLTAITWNFTFNSLFERWERRTGRTTRPLKVRVAHTLLFEAGLTLVSVPLIALILGIGLWPAFLYNTTLLVFFLVYNITYTWVFDKVFGLPSASTRETSTSTATTATVPV